MSTTSIDRARAAWGAQPPAWVVALAKACDDTSQGKVAKRLNISHAVVNQALGNKYTGRVKEFARRVRGEFLRATVICPVLREISIRRCQDEQAQPYSTHSRLAVALYDACKTCPNRRQS